MGKPHSLSVYSGEEKYVMDERDITEGQLMDLENDDVGEDRNVKDVELQWINSGI